MLCHECGHTCTQILALHLLSVFRDLFGAAARHGSVEMLDYLLSIGCPWNEYTTYSAAMARKLENLKFLLDRGCSWMTKTAEIVACEGLKPVIQFISDNNLKWDVHNVQRSVHYV